jgi:uncharacterized surface protein with fasciclin (FAS1) repeats
MRKLTTVFMGLVFISIISCDDDSKAPLDNNEGSNTESPLGRELSEAEKNGMRLLKRRQEQNKNASAVVESNTTTTYRYLVSSNDYPIFTKLMQKSSISKHIHANKVTVLAPVDEAFDNFTRYKELLLPGNEDLLDEFISYHVINTSLEYKQFSEGTEWDVHAGVTLKLTRTGGINFNGSHVRSGSIGTDGGSIIGMDDLLYTPQLEK